MAATQVLVETKADGSGVVVPAQNLVAGQSITVYAITRDAGGNFVANAAATWSFSAKTGGVVDGDLVAAVDGKSAVMTGHLVGTGVIDAAIAGLTSVDSGTITVVPTAAAALSITTQPAGVGSVDSPLTTQPVVNVVDGYGNPVADGVTVTASLVSGTGTLRNVTAVTSGGAGNATFSSLGYSKSGEIFTVKFTANGINSPASSGIGPLTLGAIASYAVSTIGTQVAGYAFNVTIQAQDQFGNSVTTGSEVVNIRSGLADTGLSPTSVTTSNGNATVNITLTVAQSGQTLIFTGATSGKTGTSNPFTVNQSFGQQLTTLTASITPLVGLMFVGFFMGMVVSSVFARRR